MRNSLREIPSVRRKNRIFATLERTSWSRRAMSNTSDESSRAWWYESDALDQNPCSRRKAVSISCLPIVAGVRLAAVDRREKVDDLFIILSTPYPLTSMPRSR